MNAFCSILFNLRIQTLDQAIQFDRWQNYWKINFIETCLLMYFMSMNFIETCFFNICYLILMCSVPIPCLRHKMQKMGEVIFFLFFYKVRLGTHEARTSHLIGFLTFFLVKVINLLKCHVLNMIDKQLDRNL